MSRLTFARSAGSAGPKMTDVCIYNIYIDRLTDRQTAGALNSQGGAHSRSPQLFSNTILAALSSVFKRIQLVRDRTRLIPGPRYCV